MNTYPVADFLIRIKNAYLAEKQSLEVPYSKMNQALAEVLVRSGYVGKVAPKKEKGRVDKIILSLIYQDKKPKLTQVINVSTPGKRVYVGRDRIPKVLGTLGIAILSTSSGLMTDSEARKKAIGGEVICKIW